jgi:hypothetical protein
MAVSVGQAFVAADENAARAELRALAREGAKVAEQRELLPSALTKQDARRPRGWQQPRADELTLRGLRVANQPLSRHRLPLSRRLVPSRRHAMI